MGISFLLMGVEKNEWGNGPEESPPRVRRVVKAMNQPQPTLPCLSVLIPFLVRRSTSKTIFEGKTQVYKAGPIASLHEWEVVLNDA